ncbi:EAL domain-containing protein [bacterium]|nr:EAL domain-containing protein [bacterium]
MDKIISFKNKKRTILVVEDEVINRETLNEILKDSYNVIFATNGKEAIDIISLNKDNISLILLDLIMPIMKGFDVLEWMILNNNLQKHIPVIVITADQKSEVESLSLGAVDFLPKPYPEPRIVLARIKRTIELFEDRETIKLTERDHLTNLYAPEYFYNYVKKYDRQYPDVNMDAVNINVRHFSRINDLYGRLTGDKVLIELSSKIKEVFSKFGGIVSRRNADVFMIYTPHIENYDDILASISELDFKKYIKNNLSIKMGVYPNVDKKLLIERRFDRAKNATDTLKTVSNSFAYFDSNLFNNELFAEQLLEDFESALQEKQFKLYYQPKYNIEGDKPKLITAEALIRWIHPTLGFISPALFIPLFEKNGLIQKMDNYVWHEAAKKISELKTKYDKDISIPISVNVSRVNIFDTDFVKNFKNIIEINHLKPSELLLEITESAYTQNQDQLIKTINELRDNGFMIEMDDFGSGYSSLNMLSSMPIDVLKIDMKLIQSVFKDKKNLRLLEITMDIKNYLKVPVVAEGVETEEQMLALKKLGCNIVQGYYFSKPLPEDDFEQLLLKELDRS